MEEVEQIAATSVLKEVIINEQDIRWIDKESQAEVRSYWWVLCEEVVWDRARRRSEWAGSSTEKGGWGFASSSGAALIFLWVAKKGLEQPILIKQKSWRLTATCPWVEAIRTPANPYHWQLSLKSAHSTTRRPSGNTEQPHRNFRRTLPNPKTRKLLREWGAKGARRSFWSDGYCLWIFGWSGGFAVGIARRERVIVGREGAIVILTIWLTKDKYSYVRITLDYLFILYFFIGFEKISRHFT